MKIHKRLLLPVLTIGVALTGLSSVVVSAQSDNNKVWCGLFNPTCAAESTPPPSQPQPQPTPPAPSPSPSPAGIYAAVGDSVAAGLGLPAATDATATDKLCGRSPEAYPALVASKQKLSLINATCSGATAGDLVSKQGVDGPNLPPQLTTAFAKGVPQLMTVTAGANDAHWSDVIKTCYSTNCTKDTYKTTLKAYLVTLEGKLAYAMADIQARSGGKPPQVLVTGYYNPLSSACLSKQEGITTAELLWLNDARDSLNSAIKKTVTAYSFVRYVPISFSGHDACAKNPWVQGLSDAAPFHPNAKGEQEYARSINAAIRR